VANWPTVRRLVHWLAGWQANAPHRPSNLTAVCEYHTIHTLCLTGYPKYYIISSYLMNKHQYAQPNMSAYWMMSRLRDQSAAMFNYHLRVLTNWLHCMLCCRHYVTRGCCRGVAQHQSWFMLAVRKHCKATSYSKSGGSFEVRCRSCTCRVSEQIFHSQVA